MTAPRLHYAVHAFAEVYVGSLTIPASLAMADMN